MFRTLLKLAVVALVANAAWHLFGAYSPNYKLQDGVQYAAQNRGQMSDDALRDKIVDIAGQFDVPLNAGDVSIKQQGTHILVDLSYVRPIELAPGFKYPWPFSIHVDVISLSSLK
jgi:putative aminopeptidase FrvX